MRRRLLIGALAVVAFIVLVLASVFIYIRSGRLDRRLQSEIVKGLAEVGVRAEIGKAHLDLSRPYKVILHDVKLYAGEKSEPFASLDSIEARFSVIDYLRQNVKITDVVVGRPRLFIEIDKHGRVNLESLHSPPETKKKGGGNVSFLSANYRIEDGDITLVDKRQETSVELTALSATLTPNDPHSVEDVLNNTLDLSFKGGSATYQGRPVQNLDGRVQATLRESDADITALKISSDLGILTAQGQVASYRPLKYDLNLNSELLLDQLSYLIKPGMRVGGKAAVHGAISGAGPDYHVTGEVASGGLAIEGFRVQGVEVATDLSGHDATLKGTARLQSAGASGAGTKAGPIKLAATIAAGPERFGVTGALSLASLQRGEITIGGITGKLEANRDRATIKDLSAAVLGGTVTGSASLAYGGGESRADLTFKSVDLEKATELASAKDVNITGTANGSASLTFPGLKYQQANGSARIQFDAAISRTEPGAESAPATGQIDLTANGRLLTVEKMAVHSANSDVTATGTLDWSANADLVVNFISKDMAEVQRALDALGLIPDDVKIKYELGLAGPGEFKGRVTGKLTEPDLTGQLNLSELQAHGEEVGSFTGEVVFAGSSLQVKDASIVRTDGSRAQFSLELPIPVENNISVNASLTDFDLHVLSAVAAPELADFVGRGAVTGKVSLTGLPGPRTIRGGGEISLSAAEFNVPSQEGEDKSKKVSVPLLTGKVSFDNNVLSVQGLQMRLENSTINGELSFNFDNYEYSIDAGGQNVDLARLGHAVSDGLDMTGQAEISVKGRGNWDDWSTTDVKAVIQGHNVALNGRDLGDARLEAHTDNGLLKVDAAGTLLDKPRTLSAVVDLRDRKNYPVNAKIDFKDEDVGPYLGLISPNLNSISGKATGTITLGGPLLDTDQIKAQAHLSRLEIGGAIAEGRTYTITNQNDISITATVNEVTIDHPVTFVGEGTSVTISGTIGSEQAGSALTVDGTLNLRLISSFSEVLYTTGLAELQATVRGTLGSPRVSGYANLKDVGFRLLDFPVSMAHGAGTIRFTEDRAAIESFSATTPGGGRLTMAGGAALVGLVPDRWRLQSFADQVAVEYPQDTQTIFDGSVVLQGNRQLQVLSGDIRVRRAVYTKDVTLSELISTGGPFTERFIQAGPGGGGGPGPRINLDMRVDADNSITVRNNILDAVATAHVRLTGPIDDPVASGRIQVDHGTTEFQNYRYEITRGMVTFTSTRGAEPIIDLQAEADIGGYHVTIPFTGAPSHLHVNPRSDPQLPANDLIALILTGRPTGDTTTTAAATQTGSGLAQTLLSATLSTELQRQTQRIFGISRVSIDPLVVGRGGQPTARVTISQKINRNLSFTYSQNVTSGPTGLDQIVLVEYYLSNRLSVIGIRDETLGSTGFNIRLRKRF
jgi:translocation and assembly module TamB